METQLSLLLPLASALATLRTTGAGAKLTALPHVVTAISDFLNHALPSIWSFLRACKINVLSLLPHPVARSIVVDVDLFFWKCQCSHLEIVKWLHENRSEECTVDAMDGAASCGYPDIVKFLHESRREGCTTRTMYRAVENGHFDIILSLHANSTGGCGLKTINQEDDFCIEYLEIAQWLHTSYPGSVDVGWGTSEDNSDSYYMTAVFSHTLGLTPTV